MGLIGVIKNGVKTKVAAKLPNLFPASRTTYDNTSSGLSANRVQGAIDEAVDLIKKCRFLDYAERPSDLNIDTASFFNAGCRIVSGVYNTSASNKPSVNQGIFVWISWDNSGVYGIEIAFDLITAITYTRSQQNGTWGAWVQH